MTIPAGVIPNTVPFTNAVDTFPFSFRTFESSNVKVTALSSTGVKTILVLATDYSLSGIGKLSGSGSIKLIDALQPWIAASVLGNGYSITIEYVIDPKQLQVFRDLGYHAPTDFEKALDKLTMDLIAVVGDPATVGVLAQEFLDKAYIPIGPQTVVAGGNVTVTKTLRQHIRVKSSGGSLALSTTPFGTNPLLFRDGMVIIVEGHDAADVLTLAEASATQYGFVGNGSLIIRKGINIAFVYNAVFERFYLNSDGAW